MSEGFSPNAADDSSTPEWVAPDGTTLADLGWDDPDPVPERPGAGLEWNRVDADGATVLVARVPDDPTTWMSLVRGGDSGTESSD